MVLVRKDLVTRGALVAQTVKNLPAMWETWVGSLCWKTPGEGNGLPLQYSCLEPGTEELYGLQSMESQRVRHN